MEIIDRNIKILVVDDFSTMRRITKNILKEMGFSNVAEAEDGLRALSVLRSQKVDYIVSDWNMPNMEGIDLLKAVRADEQLKHLPFLMVTAETKKDLILEAAKSGVDGYVIKPFSPQTFSEKFEKVWERSLLRSKK